MNVKPHVILITRKKKIEIFVLLYRYNYLQTPNKD